MDKIELIDRAAVRALAYVSTDWSHGAHPLVVELSDIDDLPTIDAAPVRRGEWKYESTFVDDVRGPRFVEIARCNLCGGAGANTNFCPNCGADMRREEHHEPEG